MNSIIKNVGLVALGGFIGTSLREFVSHTVSSFAGVPLACAPSHASSAGALGQVHEGFAWGFITGATVNPWYLLIVNLLGALVLGAIVGGLFDLDVSDRLILGTGLCGSFTTYGSLMMLPAGLAVFSLSSVLLSVLWCVLILVAGFGFALLGFKFGMAFAGSAGPQLDVSEDDSALPEDAIFIEPDTSDNGEVTR
ncbi:CrcB family protein [Actinomycetaceae bacterium TAE3-ERU4]|nr:CrcB family protein [Actinomycetaceae bacterium TAE3-ERU4]